MDLLAYWNLRERPFEPTWDTRFFFQSRDHDEALNRLTFLVGALHFKSGVQVLIEDYVHGFARKALIIFTICLSYAAAATGVFAIARIAL